MCWTRTAPSMSNKQNENSYVEMSWKRTNMSQAHAFHWAYHKNGSKKIFLDSHKVKVLKELKRLLINTIFEQAGAEFGQDQLLGFQILDLFGLCWQRPAKSFLSENYCWIIVQMRIMVSFSEALCEIWIWNLNILNLKFPIWKFGIWKFGFHSLRDTTLYLTT